MNAVLDQEAWRYSARAWRALHSQEFLAATETELPASAADAFDWPETRDCRVVFVNGELSFKHSHFDAAAVFRANGDLFELADGKCYHFVFINVPGERPARWNRELPITLDRGSAEIVEQHIGSSGAEVFGELSSRVQVGAGGRLRVTTLCDLPDSASLYRREQITIATGGTCVSTHALFGGRLQRFDLDIELAGEQASYVAHGVFAPRGRQHIDVHLDARHAARNTRSEISWRGVADQRSRGILHGAITVASGADGADAQLQTKNLLLSPHAEIDAQPVLEIHADEVRAAHGATVGQLDERALFYLRSRGLPLALARNLLIAGFCREAFVGVGDAVLRAHLEDVLAAHLPQTQQGAR